VTVASQEGHCSMELVVLPLHVI